VTTPGAPAAGVHLPWADVPEVVQEWAAGVGGGPPAAVRDLTGGFSPGATSILECPGRHVFVKAVGASLNPESPALHRREITVSAALPGGAPVPTLLESYDDGDWVALAFDVVDGRPPRHPWDPGELRAAAGALVDLHRALTPSPLPDLEPASESLAALLGGWAGLDGDTRGLHPWASANRTRLAELESGWPAASEGDTLLHCDVRSDNLLFGPAGVVFVDWPHAAIGAPVLDIVIWAPSVTLEGGSSPEELLLRNPAAAGADPAAVTSLVAAVAGFFVTHSLRPDPPGLPTLRRFQAAQGEVALAWLRRRIDAAG
jgi:hypothetical protein